MRRHATNAALNSDRDATLEVDTREFVLQRAHQQLRDVLWEGRYAVKSHAQQHARAEGFSEVDIVRVLETGKIRAVYPQDRRWLVMGYFTVGTLELPLQVVVDFDPKHFWIDVVTAFIPKNPHKIMSRGRIALMLRFDQTDVQAKTVRPGGGRGRWKRQGG
ncbi:hypothetical protein HNR42_000825 [Deinobacterium chartae]|uniref:DUF4258 domain-containing protein n=1 Tax=Deinobacterium chartae TaxID=521158 RepID=A0A841HV94_9DEIO|nr:DUF4258 domain-containing protein [Deinobacterium chartae]MBB6097411.1 hypothetical protein [Deinobacterium chartae]